MLAVDAFGNACFHGFLEGEQLFLQQAERIGIPGLLEPVAQFHLLHEEFARHRRIRFESDVHAVQRKQVLRALHRALQRAVGFVHLRRHLHGSAALGVARMREAVRMHLRLDFAVGGLEPRDVQRKGWNEAEQLEVVRR